MNVYTPIHTITKLSEFIFMKNKNSFLTIKLFNGYIAGLYEKLESKDEVSVTRTEI
jgi:hypothetical protein